MFAIVWGWLQVAVVKLDRKLNKSVKFNILVINEKWLYIRICIFDKKKG